MKTLLVALHGILTNQTDPSWPDKLDAWMFDRDPTVKVLKKEYRAGPFPHWNCWIKDPHLARSLASEIELFFHQSNHPSIHQSSPVPLWFVAHSNGAVIALLTAKILIQRGYRIAGLILTGAACEADLAKNGILEWLQPPAVSDDQLSTPNHQPPLGAAIAYSSPDDRVLSWGKLLRPYGSLGRTGWLLHGEPLTPGLASLELNASFTPTLRYSDTPSLQHSDTPSLQYSDTPTLPRVGTRWFPGGHSTYFTPENIEATFEQIYQDITATAPSPGGEGWGEGAAVQIPIKHLLNTEY